MEKLAMRRRRAQSGCGFDTQFGLEALGLQTFGNASS
jgi:hypothetical protein